MLASLIQYTPTSSQTSYYTYIDRYIRSVLLSEGIARPYFDVGQQCDLDTDACYRCAYELISVLYPISHRLTNLNLRKAKFALEQATKAQR